MSQSSSSQTDPIRSPGARRSGETLLGSSVASSVNSLASQHSMASMQGYATPQHHQGEGPPQMLSVIKYRIPEITTFECLHSNIIQILGGYNKQCKHRECMATHLNLLA